MALSASWISGQELLFSETFDDCALGSNWTVDQAGNPDARWYVGFPDNSSSDGSTIDGSCLLLFDDDATGENTPPWSVTLTSPSFDATGWGEVLLTADIHFRNYNGSAALSISVFDGAQWQPLANFQGGTGHTGQQFSEFVTLSADLSFYANPSMAIAITYDDGGEWAWWAGVDNIRVEASGEGTLVLTETFNDCELPDGWLTETQSGPASWSFGFVDNENAGAANSLNGSCFAFFDDDGVGQEADYSKAQLMTPVIDGTAYAQLNLELDVVLRRYTDLEHLAIGVRNEESGEIRWAASYFEDLGGPLFDSPVTLALDLSDYRAPSMRVVFLYDDGNNWGWWVGIDNVKLIGSGQLNDLCANAIDLQPGQPCLAGLTAGSLFTGPPTACTQASISALWYRFAAQSSQWMKLETQADYNDAIAVFQGDCGQLMPVDCTDFDEFGFTGETLYFQAEAGQVYYIRVSAQRGRFGAVQGAHCLALTAAVPPAPPANDLCAQALPLSVGQPCQASHNRHATFEGPMPSRNDKSKSDIWFQFTPAADTPLDILTQADFAEVITLYRGSCGQLEEVACNELGQSLRFEAPVAGEVYFIQISSYFATLEGSCCLLLQEAAPEPAANSDCGAAAELVLGQPCTPLSNDGLPFSGPTSSCTIGQEASMWFLFTAPASGQVVFDLESDFVATLTVFAGQCGELAEVFCRTRPDRCAQQTRLTGLNPGELYYLRLGSNRDFTGQAAAGQACLSVFDGAEVPVEQALMVFADLNCFGNGRSVLSLEAFGGHGLYAYEGNYDGQVLQHGQAYAVVVTDEAGCTAVASGTVQCAADCGLQADIALLQENDCPNDLDGLLEAWAEGGSGQWQFEWQNGYDGTLLSQVSNGVYSVTVTDVVTLCRAVAGLRLGTVEPMRLSALDITQPSSETGGAIAVNVAGGTPPYQLLWLLDGLPISELPNPTGLSPGSYTLEVTDAEGCRFSQAGIVLQSPSSSRAVQQGPFIEVYPNPSAGLFYLDAKDLNSPIQRIEVYTAAGQRLQQVAIGSHWQLPYTINLSRQPAGVYLLRAFTAEGMAQRRLVLVR